MPIDLGKIEPSTLGDGVAARLEANDAAYTAEWLRNLDNANTRLRRDGYLGPSLYDYSDVDRDRLAREACRLLRDLPAVEALGDELRDRGRNAIADATSSETALGYVAYAALSRRIEAQTTHDFANGDALRLRAVVNGRTDRVELRYTRPMLTGNLEAATSVRRALVEPTYTARIGFRQANSAIDLSHEQRGDGLGTKISAFTVRSISRDGWMLTGAVERVESAQVKDTRVVVGAMYAGRML